MVGAQAATSYSDSDDARDALDESVLSLVDGDTCPCSHVDDSLPSGPNFPVHN